MKRLPTIPDVADTPADSFESGHLWIQELVDGPTVRFQLRDSGVIRFGDTERVFDAGEIPPRLSHVARHVRETLDREALRAAVDDVESVVFVGTATLQRTIDYDWGRTPSFLGFDVWSGERDGLLAPDTVESIYRQLGFRPLNAFEKEVRAVDFDPDDYEIPDSNWYDGPAKGVIVRNKTGTRAQLLHSEFEAVDDVAPVEASAEELAREYVTPDRFERTVVKLNDQSVTFDAVYERLLEDVFRENHRDLFHDDRDIDLRAFRSEAASRVQQFVNER